MGASLSLLTSIETIWIQDGHLLSTSAEVHYYHGWCRGALWVQVCPFHGEFSVFDQSGSQMSCTFRAQPEP